MRDYSNSQFQSAPLQGSVSDLVYQQEQINANRRAEKLDREKFQYLKDENYNRRIDSFLEHNKSNFDKITFKDADLQSFYAGASFDALQEIGKLTNTLRDESRDKSKDYEITSKITSLNNSVEYLQQMVQGISPIAEKINNGELHDSPEFRTILENVKDTKVDFQTGRPRLLLKGKDGNERFIGIEEITSGIQSLGLIPKVNIIDSWDKYSQHIKSKETETVDGYTTTTKKEIPDDVAQRLAEDFVFGANGSINNGVTSYLYTKGYDPYKPIESQPGAKEELQKLTATLVDRLKNSRERSDKTKYDWTADNNAKKLQEEIRDNNRKNAIAQQNANSASKNAETSRIKTLHDIKGETINGSFGSPDSPSFDAARKKFGKLSDNAFMPEKPLEYGVLSTGKEGESFKNVKIHGITYSEKGDIVIDIESENVDGLFSRSGYKGGKTLEAQVASKLNVAPEELRRNIIGTSKPKIDY